MQKKRTILYFYCLYSSLAIIILIVWNLADIIFVKRDWDGGESKGFKWVFFVLLLILSPSTYSNLVSSTSIGREGIDLIKTGSYESKEVLEFKKILVDTCRKKIPNVEFESYCNCVSDKTIEIMGKENAHLISKANRLENENKIILDSMMSAGRVCLQNNTK